MLFHYKLKQHFTNPARIKVKLRKNQYETVNLLRKSKEKVGVTQRKLIKQQSSKQADTVWGVSLEKIAFNSVKNK